MMTMISLIDNPNVIARYNECHRYYHNVNHIAYMHTLMMQNHWDVSEDDWHLVYIAVTLHDAIYDPRRIDNEMKSAELVDILCHGLSVNARDIIKQLILYTNPETYHVEIPESIRGMVTMIRTLDLWNFIHDGGRSIAHGLKILKEYQFIPWGELVSNRNYFMYRLINTGVCDICLDTSIIRHNIEFMGLYKPHIGIYAGSFNPLHIGHMSVIEQADNHFDQLIVATPKGSCNVDDLNASLPFHRVVEFEGSLPDLVRRYQCRDGGDVTLVRGVRDQNDMTYEMNLARIYRDMGMTSGIMYLVTEYPHVSSSVIRSMIRDGISWDMYKSKKYDYAAGGRNP